MGATCQRQGREKGRAEGAVRGDSVCSTRQVEGGAEDREGDRQGEGTGSWGAELGRN